MSGTLFAGAIASYVAYKILESTSEADHDDVVQSTYDVLDGRTDESLTTLYADHIGAERNTREVMPTGADHIPDVAVQSVEEGVPNLIIEVETPASLEDEGTEALSQLQAFRVNWAHRVLVVPDDCADVGDEFGEEIDGRLTVTTPSRLTEDLL